jgi:hypothetical protein
VTAATQRAVALVLISRRWPGCPDEYALQAAAADVLTEAGAAPRREVSLSARDRVDLMVDGVVIECKVAGTCRAVLRQLGRYAEHDHVTGLVLLTSRASHVLLPSTVGGKPLTVVLTGAVL